MIVQEKTEVNGTPFVRTYSDAGYFIVDEDGNQYGEALDLEAMHRAYAESDLLIPTDEEEERALAERLERERLA